MSILSTLKSAGKATLKFTEKNSPAILTGLTIAGIFGTVVLACKATVTSVKDVEEIKKEVDDELETKKIVAICWKNYIPTFIMGSLTIACAVGSQVINHRRQAMLAAAYEMADNALKTYQEKTKEQIGKSKEKKIRSAAASEEIDKNPPNRDFLLTVGDDQLIFHDPKTGQYFKSNIDKVKKAALKCNNDMKHDRVGLNDFLYECGGNHSDLADMYYFDFFETGEIFVDDFILYTEKEFNGHTYVIGTLDYTCKDKSYY